MLFNVVRRNHPNPLWIPHTTYLLASAIQFVRALPSGAAGVGGSVIVFLMNAGVVGLETVSVELRD